MLGIGRTIHFQEFVNVNFTSWKQNLLAINLCVVVFLCRRKCKW